MEKFMAEVIEKDDINQNQAIDTEGDGATK